MLMQALRLAATTAMMCNQNSAKDRLREYQSILDAQIPKAARIFSGNDFCEINIALANADKYEVTHVPSASSNRWASIRRGTIEIRIGSRLWRSSNWDLRADGEELNGIIELLEELAPLNCRRKTPLPAEATR